MSAPTFHPPARRRNAVRISSFLVGGVVGLIAMGFLATGGLLLWAESQKDAEGYLSTGSDRYATSTHALATENLDIDGGGGDWIVDQDRYGKIRLQATPRTDKPVFVGIAPTSDVQDYLDGTRHTTITDVDYSPFDADYRDVPGMARPTAPADQDIWVASAHGTGRQTLTWDVEHGDWSVVIMNADGSAGVDAGISAGADVPIIGDLGWALTGGGLVLLTGAAVLFVIGARARPTSPTGGETEALVAA